jgi:hypothetical protein
MTDWLLVASAIWCACAGAVYAVAILNILH